MKKKILVVSALMFASASVFGQQDVALTHFIYNKMSVNPGATGMEEGYCGNLLYRNQWDKVNGAPNSAIFNLEGNVEKLYGGLGLTFTHDAIGFNRQNNLLLNYSFHKEIGPGKLGIGVGIGLINFGSNPVWVPPNTLADASLPAGSSAMTLDANFGIYYRASDWYAGISSTHLPAPQLNQTSSFTPPGATVGTVAYTAARHYYFMGGYTMRNIGDGEIDFQAMGQTDAVKTSVNLNARYIYQNFLYGGLAFRNSDAISVLLGFKPFDKKSPNSRQFLWVGYSYDLTIGKISSISNGTHELAVKYCYIPIPKITKSKHPRWL